MVQIRWNSPNSLSLANIGVSSSSKIVPLALARVLREYPYQIRWGQDRTCPQDVGMCIVILIASASYFACLASFREMKDLHCQLASLIGSDTRRRFVGTGGQCIYTLRHVYTSHRNDPQGLTEPLRCKSLAPSRACALVPRKQICLFCSPWSTFMLFPLPKLS